MLHSDPPSPTGRPVHVYAAGKRAGIFSTLKTIFAEFPMAHALGYRFAARNIKSRYRQSVLGILWALLPPLATAGVWIVLNHSNVISVKANGINYPLYVITGTMLWSVFAGAVNMPIQTIQNNTSILVKINFPREALLINAFYEVVFNTAISVMIIAGELLFFRIPLTVDLLVFFPAVLMLMLMGMCAGLLIMPLAMLFKDIQFLLPTVLQFAMYLTPVVYISPSAGAYDRILSLNPVTPVLNLAREAVMGIPFSVEMTTFYIISTIVIIALLAGMVLKRMAMEILIERMGT